MRILKLHLDGFGTFNRGLDLEFSRESLNLVVGPNETGKSTVLNAISGILFGFRDPDLAHRYEPWAEHDRYAGSLHIETEDGRQLEIWRDFKTNQATITQVTGNGSQRVLFEGVADPRGTHDDSPAWFDLIRDIIGFKDESVFRSTLFFGQQHLETQVSDQIRRLLSGASSMDYKAALHELHSRYSELTTENPWRGRPTQRKRLIEETSAQLEEGQDLLDKGRTSMARNLELEAEIARLEKDLAEREEQLESETTLREAYRRSEELLGRRVHAERRNADALQRRDRLHSHQRRFDAVREEAKLKFAHFRNIPKNFPETARTFANEREEIRRESDQLKHEKKAASTLRPRLNNRNGFLIGAALAALAVIAGVVLPDAMGPALIGAAILFALGFAFGRQVGTGFAAEKAAIDERIAHLQASIHGREERCKELIAATGTALVSRSPEEAIAEFEVFIELRQEGKREHAAIRALGDAITVETEYSEANAERGRIDAALEQLNLDTPGLKPCETADLARSEIAETQRKIAWYEDAIRDLRARLQGCRIEQAGLEARMELNLVELAEGVRTHRKQLEDLDLERDALKEAIDVLDSCVRDLQECDIARLSDEISGIFAHITDGRYSRVHLDASMEPLVSRDGGEQILPRDLSQGARDQLYFAMRVALARHLAREAHLPFFLDDPFVNFDAERLATTKSVLDKLDEHQVIMVTCNPDYGAWSNSVIDLAKRAA